MKVTAKVFPLLFLVTLAFSPSILAAEPSRLAILSQGETSQAADLLTATLSANEKLSLLERAEIDKVFREQKLSASGATKDVLKLGQLLGADGVLILETNRESTNTFLNARLVAVKPGVVLSAVSAPWPLQDMAEWTKMVGHRFEPLFPKLSVLTKDALPISILNLRAAANSTDSRETEKELTLLLLNRLMRERDLFVLERRRMDALSSEKELSENVNSPFWNGAYLLEGVIDKEGFILEQITINARFSPPNGGKPTEIEVTGPRKDLVQVAEQLTAKILEALQKTSSAPAWKPADEATRYFEEAKWALKWGLAKEAQAAADSAWALGKRDMDAAMVRIKAYAADAWPDTGGYVTTVAGFQDYSPQQMGKIVQDLSTNHSHGGFAMDLSDLDKGIIRHVSSPPADPQKLEQALHILRLFTDFNRTLGTEEPKVDSPWYQLGLETLGAASATLQHFHFAAKSRAGFEDDLAELRTLTRGVAQRVAQSPTVTATYFTGDRPVVFNEIYRRIRSESIFWIIAERGCFWQETPEECVALYRHLMSSEVFPFLQHLLWARGLESPLLISWNPEDETRIPGVWKIFLGELAASTNVFLRIEGRFLEFDAAKTEAELEAAFDAVFDLILSNRAVIIRRHADFPFDAHIGNQIVNRGGGKLSQRYREKVRPHLEEIKSVLHAVLEQRQKAAEGRANFERQKAFLQNNLPYSHRDFLKIFYSSGPTYSRGEAEEIKPLIEAYRASQLAQSNTVAPLQADALWENVNRVLNAPEPADNPAAQALPASVLVVSPPASKASATAISPLLARFLKIPTAHLSEEAVAELRVIAHRYQEGRVWLDLRFTGEAMPDGWRRRGRGWAAALSPETGAWTWIDYPQEFALSPFSPAMMSHHEAERPFICFDGFFYLSARNGLKKYDLKNQTWTDLNVPVSGPGQFFTVQNRLFHASHSSLVELLDGGKQTHVLASTRRRPTVTRLDGCESLAGLEVLPGPDESIRACLGNKIFSWSETDWKEDFTFSPSIRVSAHGREQAMIFASQAFAKTKRVWLLPHSQVKPELALSIPLRIGQAAPYPTLIPISSETENGDLYFLHAQMTPTTVPGRWQMAEKDGRLADLICFLRVAIRPVTIPLKFDGTFGPFPQLHWANPSAAFWLVWTPENLVIGQMAAPGCWIVPRKEIEAVIAQKKQTIQQWTKTEWPLIDTNQNGLLDGEDNWLPFDRNENGVMEDVEWAAVNKAQGVVAARLLEKFDGDKNGLLAADEMKKMAAEAPAGKPSGWFYFDPRVFNLEKNVGWDAANLKLLLERLTQHSVFAASPRQDGPPPWLPPDLEEHRWMELNDIEALWRQAR